MIDSLFDCYKRKILVSLYCDPEDSQKHYTGYITGVNDREIMISHISKNGYYDGYILRQTEDVYRIDYGGEYERRIEDLYKAKGQKHTISLTKEAEETLFLFALKTAKEHGFVVSLMFNDDHRSGLIKHYTEDIVCLYALNDNGEKDGVAVVKTAEILVIEIDTDYEQDLKLLYDLKNKRSTEDGLRKP